MAAMIASVICVLVASLPKSPVHITSPQSASNGAR